ncbi:MAG: translation initiation factor IF-2 [Candidatus Woesearchaeota archaeon]
MKTMKTRKNEEEVESNSKELQKEQKDGVLRSPICVVVGHVDHGKSSLLDKIRGTLIVESEPGKITQAIGASLIPLPTIQKICAGCVRNIKIDYRIPGLLFIDTPGHAAFRSLRKRGGNLADIAILVVDINEGFKPQTEESMEILRSYKTPFVVAANKIDLIPGWKSCPELTIENDIRAQTENVQKELDIRIYKIVESLYKFGFNSERFDRVEDYTKQVAIVPVSAKTGEGLPELLMILTGLTQRFMENSLKTRTSNFGKGTILEVKDEQGLGRTIDVILYEGLLRKNQTIIVGSLDKPIITKIRCLLEPMPLSEMRNKKTSFKQVDVVYASTGVKILAPNLENVFSGMPVVGISEGANVEKISKEIQAEVEEVLINTENEGVVVKADSLGSLEAMLFLLRENNIPVRKSSLGYITKKDILTAETNKEEYRVVIGFNVKLSKEAEDYLSSCQNSIKIISGNIIYKIVNEYKEFLANIEKERINKELSCLTRPCRIRIMPQYVFRQSNPAIVGVDVEAGILRAGINLMNSEGKEITTVKSIQLENKSISEASKKQVAVSLENVTFGRQIKGNDVLYSSIPESDFKRLKELKKHLSSEEIEVLKEIASIMRKQNPVWGI